MCHFHSRLIRLFGLASAFCLIWKFSQAKVFSELGLAFVFTFYLSFQSRLPGLPFSRKEEILLPITEPAVALSGSVGLIISDSKVRYIELGPSRNYRLFYGEHSVFETPAEEMMEVIKRDGAYDASGSEFPVTVIFPSLELGLWRRCLPEESGGEDGVFFETLLIGIQGYYSAASFWR